MNLKRDQKSSLTLFSPAKINLFFRVLSKRRDGYHEIASLMQAISLGDHLSFQMSSKDELTCSDPSLPCGKTNLVAKGISLFRKKTGFDQALSVHIDKKIPVQGGLGGGSSNLATTLWALKELSGKQIPLSDLIEWAGELSSDAPFFFSSGRAFCEGRGEKISSLLPVSPQEVHLFKPKEGLSTPLVYQHAIPHAVSKDHPHTLLEKKEWVNDLEASAFFLKPKLKKLKESLLLAGWNTVLMTGSGTTFFCIGSSSKTLPPIWNHKAVFTFRNENDWYNTH